MPIFLQGGEQFVSDVIARTNFISNDDWDEANFAGAGGRDFLSPRWGWSAL
jgi:hypothetical protein